MVKLKKSKKYKNSWIKIETREKSIFPSTEHRWQVIRIKQPTMQRGSESILLKSFKTKSQAMKFARSR